MGPTAIVASAEVFADALVAGPFAARGIHPVLLSGPDVLPADVASYLDTSGVSHVVVMGGTKALSAEVEMAIEALGVKVTRLAGTTRYDTAVKAAELVTGRYHTAGGESCFATSTVGLARARVPFDSFSAAPLLGRLCAPLVLADPTRIPADTAAFLDTAREANATVDLRVFGGDAAVSQAAIDAYLAGERTNQPDDDDSDAGYAVPVGLPVGTCGGSIEDEPRPLLDSDDAEGPAWSPDCSKIVYTYRGSLWTLNNDGTNRQQLTAYDGSYSNEPAWSPDGSRVAYRRGQHNNDGHWISHIYVVNTDGTGRAQVSTGDVWDGQPSWSPDGSRIAFASRSGESRDDDGNFVDSTQRIVTVDADGSDRAVLTPDGQWHGSPAWSPDGNRIAYVSGGTVWLIDPEFDFAKFDSVVTVFPRAHFTAAVGGHFVTVDGKTMRNPYINFKPVDGQPHRHDARRWGHTVAHELVHGHGLVDYYPYDRSKHEQPEAPSGREWVAVNWGLFELWAWFLADDDDRRLRHTWRHPARQTNFGYNTRLEPREMLAWSRWQLGWLAESQVRCIEDATGAETVALRPIAQPGDGAAMVAIQLSAREAIVIESRRELGDDRPTARDGTGGWRTVVPNLAGEGVLVYTVDSFIDTGQLPLKFAGDSGNGQVDDFPALRPGESVTVRVLRLTSPRSVGR